MKRFILTVILFSVFLPNIFAARQDGGTVIGSVMDSTGNPLAFATVYLTRQGGEIVTGDATDESGRFSLKAPRGEFTLTASLIGYKDGTRSISLASGTVDLGVISLEEDTGMLEGATIEAVMPKTKLTGEGLQTNVRGSVLENVGNANDVLAKTPGIISKDSGIEVIGKGSPLVYINGRKVTDSSELERLQSNEIQSVEVITNPGAQYDATVRSVVRIRTIRRQGDGFGFNFNASDSQSPRWYQNNDPNAGLNVNYRTGGVDLFGGANYSRNSFRQESDIDKTSFGKDFLIRDTGSLTNEYHGNTVYGNAGVNWQLANNHFLGGKVEWGRHLTYDVRTTVTSSVSKDGTPVDDIVTESEDHIGARIPYNLGGNIYYNGLIGGKLGVDVNLDYYGTDDSASSVSEETSPMTHDARILSDSYNTGRLYAAKAVLSCPVWRGQLQFGTEETFSRREDVYSISGVDIPASSASIKEDNIAGFASYGVALDKLGMINAGVRYEHIRYSYMDALAPKNDLQRKYGNWFPTLSWAGAAGPVQLMLNYSAKTTRPNYANLSSAIRYNSRYTWQSGNAQLQPELSHNVSATTVWNYITLMVNYTRTDNAIVTWSTAWDDEGVVLVKPRNIETPYRTMSAFVNLTPTVGPWNMNYTLGVQPQWLTVNAPDPREPSGIRVTKFNGRPIWFAQLLNTLTVKGGWQFELGGLVQSRGYSQTLLVRNVYANVTAAVQKTLLRDGSLVIRLDGQDLLGTAMMNVFADFGSHTFYQTNLMDTSRLELSVRYSFNSAQSKYRGTGAGSEEKARM